jgi:hypothetical protein
VAPHSIDRDPHQLGVEASEFIEKLVIESELVAADGAPVCRVEDQDNRTAPEIRKPKARVGSCWQGEVRSGCSGGKRFR